MDFPLLPLPPEPPPREEGVLEVGEGYRLADEGALRPRNPPEPRPRRSRGPRVVEYRWPFVRGVFDFPFYTTQWYGWLLLAGFLTLLGSLLDIAMQALARAEPGTAVVGPEAWLLGVVSTLFLVMIGLFFVLFAGSYAERVIEQTAAGADREVNGLAPVWYEWLPEAAVVVCAVVFSTMPGSALQAILRGQGISLPVGVPASMFVCFPVLILSMLEGDSISMLVSWPVARSLWICRRAWGRFYLCSAVLLTMVAGGCWCSWRLLGSWGGPLASLWIAAGLLIYCRLLGRLTWFIPESRLSEESDEEEGDAQDDDAETENSLVPEQSPGLMVHRE